MTKYIVTILLMLITCNHANARWANQDDASAIINHSDIKFYVKQDGNYKKVSQQLLTLKNQNGVDSLSNRIIYYNAGQYKFSILDAKTINNEQIIPVNNTYIEDKPVASNSLGFDETHKITIAYPKTSVGSQLYIKATEETIDPIMNHFSTNIYYDGDLIEESNINIVSEIPLYLQINDPNAILEVKQSHTNGLYNIDIRLIKPIYEQVIHENNAVLINNKVTFVKISSFKSYEQFANNLRPDYLKVLQQRLPKAYQEIANAASTASTITAKINIVTTMLQEKIRYMGDWRTNNGKYIPRDLQKVVDSEYGDCKDMATATAAILRSMGITAHVALVSRGDFYDNTYHKKFPTTSDYNHLITVVYHNKEILWIDPTNSISMAGKIFFDISAREALVITDPKTPKQNIPAIKSTDNLTEQFTNEIFNSSNIHTILGEIFLQNQAANILTAANLFTSQDNIEEYIFNKVGDSKKMLTKQINMPELNSRVVQDLNISYEFTQKSNNIITNAGEGIILPSYGHMYIKEPNRIADMYIGMPSITNNNRMFSGIKATDTNLQDVNIDSPWISIQRKIKYGDNYVNVHDVLTIKKTIITNEELQSEVYNKFADQLEEHFIKPTAIIFNRVTN